MSDMPPVKRSQSPVKARRAERDDNGKSKADKLRNFRCFDKLSLLFESKSFLPRLVLVFWTWLGRRWPFVDRVCKRAATHYQ